MTKLDAVVDVGPACPPVPGKRRRQAEGAFNLAIIVSGVRCTLAYVILPFALPFLGLAPGVGPTLGLAIGTVAIIFNVTSMRRFWRIRHPWRKPVTVIHIGMIAFLLFLMVNDARTLIA